MATRQSYGSLQGHQGPHGPICVPVSVQDIVSKGRSRGALAPTCSSSSCLFVLPARPSVKIKVGIATSHKLLQLHTFRSPMHHAAAPPTPDHCCLSCCAMQGLAHASSRHAQHSSRPYSYRVLHRGQSLVYCRAARRSSISSAHDSGSASDR